ncbi:hypothetical protein FRC02_003417 [Tulasnella sp. 418]|nr:hypothetical protein FRC02_003417 [Tulasnella sp. 418]
MLERVNSTLQDNSVFHGLLPELIIPAVRSKEPLMRERGLVCLGLCCLIDKKVALSSFPLFVQQVQVAAEDLKKRVLETVFDLLMVYESEFFKQENKTEELLVQLLDQDSPDVQAIACEGVAKLMLSGMVRDEKLLRNLVILYLIPETEDNQPLRQCLSYFFPVYCYSSPLNQQRMRQVFLHTYDLLQRHRSDLEPGQEMIPASQIALLFVDWTDPEKAVEVKDQAIDTAVHVDLAIDVMKTLLKQKLNKEDKKTLCQLLPKLYIPEDLEQDKAKLLKVLASTLHKRRPPNDTVARNAVARFDKSLDKKLATQLEGFTQANYLDLKQLQDMFDDADDIINGGDDDDAESINVDDDDRAEKTPPAHGQARKNARAKQTKASKSKKGHEGDVDKDIDDLLDSGAESASVAASQPDEEEDEVESVLGAEDDDTETE